MFSVIVLSMLVLPIPLQKGEEEIVGEFAIVEIVLTESPLLAEP